jgi:hypothetical protein
MNVFYDMEKADISVEELPFSLDALMPRLQSLSSQFHEYDISYWIRSDYMSKKYILTVHAESDNYNQRASLLIDDQIVSCDTYAVCLCKSLTEELAQMRLVLDARKLIGV